MAPARSSAARAARDRLAASLALKATCCTVAAVYFSWARSRSLSSALPARHTGSFDDDNEMVPFTGVNH